MSRPHLLVTIIKNVINSLKPRTFRGTVVGKDHLGNTYYQIEGNANQRKQRWFDPKEKDDFEQEIPAEWESWLRYRRKVPPLEEEVLANAELAKLKKLRADESEAQRVPKLAEPELKPKPKGLGSFPSYKDYEVIPGKNPEKN